MFDMFQIFGKKKSNTENEKDKNSDDFVMLGHSEQPEQNPGERPLPKNPNTARFLPDNFTPTPIIKKEEKHHPIMPLQDVPFTINSSLYASSKLDQIWKSVSQSIGSIGNSCPYQEDYDFALEKSVIAETCNK
ncbi:uncharacterized protein [Parasteatoda tepidariorum]|uniref:uncharacterized protein n=1 Tax=Parasteatoda tepidariorum TaxID=114398 RepID=UPI00077F83DC|nr:uncharacterized protein LOC107437395 [Parasteatoda tepidariorum]XP_042898309.1 uncharacterized protein LOC107437395 [Parasteatoda tepidariorum]